MVQQFHSVTAMVALVMVVAALGFRDALGADAAERFPERVAALDRRLAEP